ncbi:hypothetical protein BJF85_23845 [Saccharomonospora sp. CUA-673]|nr:hypothetical protein BJF85_23845 [Saccharomonospora sp. CUA-673]
MRSLRTKRFARLMEEWSAELTRIEDAGMPSEAGAGKADGAAGDPAAAGSESADAPTDPEWPVAKTDSRPEPESEAAEVPDVARFARKRLAATAKRVTRRAAAITPESPADDVHDLRKRCKELRYLLEFAQPLCRQGEYSAVLKRLKRLQDILGAFQDGEVQSLDLRERAAEMSESGRAPVGTLLAMGELAGTFAVDQQRARHELTEALRRFLGEDMRKRITSLVK